MSTSLLDRARKVIDEFRSFPEYGAHPHREAKEGTVAIAHLRYDFGGRVRRSQDAHAAASAALVAYADALRAAGFDVRPAPRPYHDSEGWYIELRVRDGAPGQPDAPDERPAWEPPPGTMPIEMADGTTIYVASEPGAK